jgi:hypothetical protein
MTAARQQRRRKVIVRFWLAAVPVVVLLAVVVVLLAVYGGQGGEDSAATTLTTVGRQQAEGSGLLFVEDGDALPWVVLLEPWDSGGVILVVPGITLLESDGAFQTLADIYKSVGTNTAKAALVEALEMPLGPAASVEWSALQAAAAAVHVEGLADVTSGSGQGEAESLAAAVRTLVSETASDGTVSPWEDMHLQGEAAEFLAAIRVDRLSMADSVWTAGVLTGRTVDGEDFTYLEPDLQTAKSLLAVTEQTTSLLVEVKDGAGIEGAARRAGSLLESGGFSLAPMSYADGYPGVEKTLVIITPQTVNEAEQVRALLGVGEVVEDETLTTHQIVVILGKDFGGGSP